MLSIVRRLERRLAELDEALADPANLTNRKRQIELNRERRQVYDVLETGRRYAKLLQVVTEAREIISANEDSELVEMALEELPANEAELEEVELEFQVQLLPSDPTDTKNAMIEMRAGTGGDEAGIFVGNIFRMYQRFVEDLGWKIDVQYSSPSSAGGFKEVVFSVEGEGAYGMMRYESGVHRVQRVPATETQGRIHTSAITVAVFPEAEELDIEIAESDLKVDVFRSSGPGGQSVNTTDSAVRITYLPTNLVVTCQDEKSQIKNKVKAMRVLRARLYDQKISEQRAKQDEARRSMVATGDRSAKIRTYNFPQSRVTDHRIGLTLYKLDEILNGKVNELIDPLRRHDQEERLKLHSEESPA